MFDDHHHHCEPHGNDAGREKWGGGSTKTAWHWEIRYGDRIVNDGGKTFSDAEQAAAAAVAKVRELRYT